MLEIYVVVCSYVDIYGNRKRDIAAVELSYSSAYKIASRRRSFLNSYWDVAIVKYRRTSIVAFNPKEDYDGAVQAAPPESQKKAI